MLVVLTRRRTGLDDRRDAKDLTILCPMPKQTPLSLTKEKRHVHEFDQ
jgi:hypothetical protein